MQRNGSSQFSNYMDRGMSNSRLGKNTMSSHFSDHSLKNMREINNINEKLYRLSTNVDEKHLLTKYPDVQRKTTELSPLTRAECTKTKVRESKLKKRKAGALGERGGAHSQLRNESFR